MATIKLTKRTIDALPAPHPSGRQQLLWDQDLKGFGLLVSGTSSTKSFVVQRDLAGRTCRVTLGTVPEFRAAQVSIEQVRQQASKMLLEMRQGKDPKAARRADANISMHEVVELYLAARPKLAARTRTSFPAVIKFCWPDRYEQPLRHITPELVEERFREIKDEVAAHLEREQAARKKRGAKDNGLLASLRSTEPGAASANNALRAFRTLWNFAMERVPELPANPVARLKRQWNPAPPRERHVSADNLKAFYDAVDSLDNSTMRDYIKLLLFTGFRRGEAAGLRWTDVDFAARVIRIPARATKAKRRLDIPMSDYLHSLLVARRALGYENQYVFPGNGTDGHIMEPKKAFDEIAKTCGIRVSPHDLRRTFISVAAMTSMPVLALKALVNHGLGTGDVTANYAQISIDQLRGPAQAIADALKLHCGIESPEGALEMKRA